MANLPWQNRPENNKDILWRYSKNPIINRYDIPSSNSIFNSAVVPYKEGFAGVFRCDNKAIQMNDVARVKLRTTVPLFIVYMYEPNVRGFSIAQVITIKEHKVFFVAKGNNPLTCIMATFRLVKYICPAWQSKTICLKQTCSPNRIR